MKINTPSQLRRAVTAMQGDIIVIGAYIDAALQQIDQGLPGFPSGLDGGGGSDGLNTVERLATTPDQARQLLDKMMRHGGRAYDELADLAQLVRLVGLTPKEPPVVKGDIPDGWCENHYNLKLGFEQTRRVGGTYCRFCEDVKNMKEYGNKLPTRQLLELRARKGRLSTEDVARLMKGRAA